jgi:hypothetical protein
MKRSVAVLLVLSVHLASGMWRPAYGQVTKVQPFVEYVERLRTPVNYAELKDFLTIKVVNLQEWRRANEMVPLFLFLGDVQLASLAVMTEPGSTTNGLVRVHLEVDEKNGENRKSWVQVLKTARQKANGISVSVGPSGTPFPSKASLVLRVEPSYRYWVWAFLALVVAAIVVLGRSTNMLRDANGAMRPPHSLAKYQMAVWFVVVVGSYLYVWIITGTFSAISATALTLIGISGATGLVAVAMDNSKRDEALRARVTLLAEHDALDSGLNAPGGLRAQLAAAAAGSPESQQIVATITTKHTRLNELNAVAVRSGPRCGAQPPLVSRPARRSVRCQFSPSSDGGLDDRPGVRLHPRRSTRRADANVRRDATRTTWHQLRHVPRLQVAGSDQVDCVQSDLSMTRRSIVFSTLCLLGLAPGGAAAQDTAWSIRIATGWNLSGETNSALPDAEVRVKPGAVVAAEVATTLTPKFSAKVEFWSLNTPVTFRLPGGAEDHDRMLQSVLLIGFPMRHGLGDSCGDCRSIVADFRVTWLQLPIGLSTGDHLSYPLITTAGLTYRF